MRKRAQLVCQHLENISRAALEEQQDIVRQYVRGRQGVYALYRGTQLYYIGLAANLRNRLKQHLKDRHGHSWDRFSVYLTIGDHHLRELEALMLRVMKPAGNKQKGKFARSEDLKRSFRKTMKAKVLAGLDGMFGDTWTRDTVQNVAAVKPKRGRGSDLADYCKGTLKLRAVFKGKELRATVRRDGSVRFAGTVYTSPSLAAAVACKRSTCNGWTFWHYERAPGDWVPLDKLRR